jgi:phage regulator Rha-like protein
VPNWHLKKTATGRGKHRKYLPYVFNEQGVAMLSAVLSSPVAVKISIQIMNAFVEMRRIISDNTVLFQRMDRIELKQLETDRKILQVFQALEQKNPRPQQGIFFDGQIFDAYLFVTGIIKVACRGNNSDR